MEASMLALADGVYAWVHDVQDRFTCNVGVIVEDDGLILIDSSGRRSSYEALGRELLRFGRPVRKLILTHAHPDHIAGAGYFNPGEILASAASQSSLQTPPMITALQALHPQVADELVELQHPLPSKVIEGPHTFGRITLEHVVGHTQGDLMVRVADADVLFAGDLCFFEQVPLGVGAHFESWIAALACLVSAQERIVPGHGPIGTAVQAQGVRDYLEAVLDAASRQTSLRTGPWDAWYDPWSERLPYACHRINIECAQNPTQVPPTMLRLIRGSNG